MRVAVNVPGPQVIERDFVRMVIAACEAADLDPATAYPAGLPRFAWHRRRLDSEPPPLNI